MDHGLDRVVHNSTYHGRPMKFNWNPELLGMDRQIGQINSWAFVVFSAEQSAPIGPLWYLVSPLSMFSITYSTNIVDKKLCKPTPQYLVLLKVRNDFGPSKLFWTVTNSRRMKHCQWLNKAINRSKRKMRNDFGPIEYR